MNDARRHPKHDRRRGKLASPRSTTITVYLKSVGPPPECVADFDIVTTLKTSGGGHNPPIIFQNGGYDGFDITFDLVDLTNNGAGSGYRFPKNSDDAVWSQIGTTCPLTPISDVFTNVKVQGPKKLTVFNENPDVGNNEGQGYFQYTLNVTTDKNGNGPPYVHLDPGGINMNGGSGFNQQ